MRLILLNIFFFFTLCTSSLAFSIKDALQSAEKSLPSYQATLHKAKASKETYKSTLSPYLPTVSFKTTEIHTEDQKSRALGVALNYTLFDGGIRSAQREIALQSLHIDEHERQKTLLDLHYTVKVAFYKTIAQHEIVSLRTTQLKDAQTDYDAVIGRRQVGIATLADTLQAQVRLQQAKYNLIVSEGEFKKALYELNSLCGRDISAPYDLVGDINWEPKTMLRADMLLPKILNRPEVLQAKANVDIAIKNKEIEDSKFYPTITVTASYEKSLYAPAGQSKPENKNLSLGVSWNLFELAKFYKRKTYDYERLSASDRLNDLTRSLTVQLYSLVQDFNTALSKLKVAKEQLAQAEHNYTQALGQYKAGKADVVFLLQAESQLSASREQLVDAKFNLLVQRFKLESFVAISNIEEIL